MTMVAEDLVALAAAHGVDLVRAAKMAAKEKPKPEVVGGVLQVPPSNLAQGRETRPIERPRWSMAELGHAAAGVPRISFLAACFAFAGDRSHFWQLHAALTERATILAIESGWPLEIVDHHGIRMPYLAHLAKLVLDADANPAQFKIPTVCLHAIYLGVHRKTWEKHVEIRFLALQSIWEDWLSEAARVIQSKLSEREGV